MQNSPTSHDEAEVRKVAYLILSHFDKSYRWFSRITRGAQQRFEKGDWRETQQASKDRITIYEQSLSDAVAEIYQITDVHQKVDSFWQSLKKNFAVQLEGHPQFELAETFYNSVIGRLFKHRKIDNDMMFVLPSRCFLPGQDRDKVINSFDTTTTVREMYESIFKIYRYNIPFENF
ncbi:MAG: isocitrate dehydrogenase kinase/phosphatase AceK regulatory subunit, partial [Pseudomonadota bacterium]|nr:isocitrate dehydrogenase kinase/phosphatase AceK regulatory subunit [Pseudomonadota bacterium]